MVLALLCLKRLKIIAGHLTSQLLGTE